jgi:hypothetical protein
MECAIFKKLNDYVRLRPLRFFGGGDFINRISGWQVQAAVTMSHESSCMITTSSDDSTMNPRMMVAFSIIIMYSFRCNRLSVSAYERRSSSRGCVDMAPCHNG